MLVLVCLSFAGANLHAALWQNSEWLISSVLPSVIVELTNEERDEHVVGGLSRSAVLDVAASLKAEHMAEHQYFAHYAPDGTSPWYWFEQVGYRYTNAGENLAVHFTDSGDVVEAWMNSPGHRANILNREYTQIGVGSAQGTYKGHDTVFVVQLFGTPASGGQTTRSAPATDADTDSSGGAVGQKTATTGRAALQPPRATSGNALSENPPSAVLPAEQARPDGRHATLTPFLDRETLATLAAEGGSVRSGMETHAPDARDAASRTIAAGHASSGSTPIIARLATGPHAALETVYFALAAFVTVALILSIGIEWRRQHPVQIIYGMGLLALMATLFYIHTLISGGATIV